jgi:hypothetical protein
MLLFIAVHAIGEATLFTPLVMGSRKSLQRGSVLTLERAFNTGANRKAKLSL